MKHLILTSLLLTACGAENQLKTDENGTPIFNAPAIKNQPSEKEVVIEYRKDGDQTSAVYEDTNNLPTCSNNNFGARAYIKRIAKFFTCNGIAWSEDLSEQVLKIPAEIKKDEAPIKTPNEATTKAVEPKEPERIYTNSTYYGSQNIWVDPVTNDVWMYSGRYSFQDSTGARAGCNSGFALPSVSEAQGAIRNGLLVAIKELAGLSAPEEIWTTELAYGQTFGSTDLELLHASVSASGEVRAIYQNPLAGPACLKAK